MITDASYKAVDVFFKQVQCFILKCLIAFICKQYYIRRLSCS